MARILGLVPGRYFQAVAESAEARAAGRNSCELVSPSFRMLRSERPRRDYSEPIPSGHRLRTRALPDFPKSRLWTFSSRQRRHSSRHAGQHRRGLPTRRTLRGSRSRSRLETPRVGHRARSVSFRSVEGISDKEITIVGGGIAGLSLGIALRERDIPVTLMDAGTYPRHRVCGEFISGVSNATLAVLGVEDFFADAEKCVTTSWHDRGGSFYSTELPSPALGISRYRLDRRMAERLRERGGHVREKERFRETDDPAEGTVLATGRPRNSESEWIGLKAHLVGFELETDLEMHLGEHGYLGLSRIEN